MSIKWNDDKVKERMKKAARYGVDKIMSLCIQSAKPQYYEGHGFVTGALQGSIRMKPAITRHNGETVGEWGSFQLNYAEKIEKLQGQLFGAADEHYSKLAAAIKEGLA